ncbi:uncharacterized protein UV8b_03972 [Ustilaginoidea virens]|uniref:G-patch domain-containing protein n=1 Tax=Ustilaginoidea virens TaxID=1159556 RepID=A0A063BSZ8_USTVR|nr:uncharacterized protein UV8b_03972 [Ustilaginoidea virens]QUC19731.1 hypothetical protein UV8b_03972 [Ustilaginoidea virens]GAO13797.1 hypothetical protein UVI_02004800 [Ustilaginoidea virens]
MAHPEGNVCAEAETGEDDYMNMTFEEPAPRVETSLQRIKRLKKESLARGMVKSKAQLAEEEAAAREKALTTSMLDAPTGKRSKGFAMMAKMGFTGGGLGKKDEQSGNPGTPEPIKVNIKEDRGGIGMDSEKKRKMHEAMDGRVAKSVKVDPDEYRERVRKEREDERLEKQFEAAQRVAERMDDEQSQSEVSSASRQGPGSGSSSAPFPARPLRSIPVLYRGLVRRREERERDRRMRYDLEQSLSRLPTYDDADDDEEDQIALGKKQMLYVTAEDLDQEDEELEEFDAREPAERLGQLVKYLRERHRYCFWCKMQYDDEALDGCPGPTEEDHD